MADRRSLPGRLAAGMMLGVIRIYWWTLSPLIGGQCRFEPTCSRYADEAIRRHGPWRGGRLALRRICRCHPFGGEGYDPCPPTSPTSPSNGETPPPGAPEADGGSGRDAGAG